MKALIVDDSRSMRAIIGKHLRELGFELHEAASGTEALLLLRQLKTVDVVLVDWNMPEMDGYEFLRAVRAEPQWQDLCLMMVTTESEMSQVAIALEGGANEYLMKPFDKQALHEKLLLLGIDPEARAA